MQGTITTTNALRLALALTLTRPRAVHFLVPAHATRNSNFATDAAEITEPTTPYFTVGKVFLMTLDTSGDGGDELRKWVKLMGFKVIDVFFGRGWEGWCWI